jgi:hypothetical protein
MFAHKRQFRHRAPFLSSEPTAGLRAIMNGRDASSDGAPKIIAQNPTDPQSIRWTRLKQLVRRMLQIRLLVQPLFDQLDPT